MGLLIILAIIIYLIIGNILIRTFHKMSLIYVYDSDETLIFIFGIILPLILLYIVVKEVSFYIYAKCLDYIEDIQKHKEEQMGSNTYEYYTDDSGTQFYKEKRK